MIKITYEMQDEKMVKPEITKINIFDGKMFIQYNIPNKALSIVNKMKQDGRTNVLFSRGAMIQMFPNKTEDEILEIAKKDIENGLYIAEQKTKKKFEVKNMVIEKK